MTTTVHSETQAPKNALTERASLYSRVDDALRVVYPLKYWGVLGGVAVVAAAGIWWADYQVKHTAFAAIGWAQFALVVGASAFAFFMARRGASLAMAVWGYSSIVQDKPRLLRLALANVERATAALVMAETAHDSPARQDLLFAAGSLRIAHENALLAAERHPHVDLLLMAHELLKLDGAKLTRKQALSLAADQLKDKQRARLAFATQQRELADAINRRIEEAGELLETVAPTVRVVPAPVSESAPTQERPELPLAYEPLTQRGEELAADFVGPDTIREEPLTTRD